MILKYVQFSSVQSLSRVRLFATPWSAACQASLPITNSQSVLKLMSIESVMPSNHLILCQPLLLPSTFPSIRVFSNESVLCIRWPKFWSFRFSISPSNECSGLTSFRMDWLDQANLKQWSEMLQFALIMHCAIITCYLGPNFNSLPMISVVIFIVTAKTYWVFTMCVK